MISTLMQLVFIIYDTPVRLVPVNGFEGGGETAAPLLVFNPGDRK